jgi:hypothetical protein
MNNTPDTLWLQLVTKLNSLEKTTEEFKSSDKYIHVYRQWLTKEFPYRETTIDRYILLLVSAGYIKKTKMRGHYLKIADIPEEIPRVKFERNYRGRMLWIEQVTTFYNLYRS